MSDKVQVVFRGASYKIKAGQKLSVDKETADQLVADKHADLASDVKAGK